MNKKRNAENGLNMTIAKLIVLAIWIAALLFFYETGKMIAFEIMH